MKLCLSLHPAFGLKILFCFLARPQCTMWGRNPGQSPERVRRTLLGGLEESNFPGYAIVSSPGRSSGIIPAKHYYSFYMEEDFPRAHNPGGKSRFWFLGREDLGWAGGTLKPSNFRLVTKLHSRDETFVTFNVTLRTKAGESSDFVHD